MENLTKLAYSEFSAHYSRRNYFSNEPLWYQLSDKDKTFWTDFVKGIRLGFKNDNKPEPIPPIESTLTATAK